MSAERSVIQFRGAARSDRDLEQEYLAKAATLPETQISGTGHVSTLRANLRAAARAAAARAQQWDAIADRLEAAS